MTLGLYQENDNKDVSHTLEDIVENIIEEIQSFAAASRKPASNTGKLNLDIHREKQQWDQFWKVRDIRRTTDPASY